MATTIDLYDTVITPSRNALVDDINDYLDNEGSFYHSNIQFQKFDLDMTLKLNMDQSNFTQQTVGNYAKIVQGDGEQGFKTYYYFITAANWLSLNTVELVLSIDSINTFRNAITISPKTNVIREHRNRFRAGTRITPNASNTLYMTVDKTDEGLGSLYKVRESNTIITEEEDSELDQSWYLVYRSPETPTDASPIECLLMPEQANSIKYATATSAVTWSISNFLTGYTYYFLKEDNPGGSVTVNGNTYTFTSSNYLIAIVIQKTASNKISVFRVYTSDTGTTRNDIIYEASSVSFRWNNSIKYRRSTIYTMDFADVASFTSYPMLVSSSGNRYIRDIGKIDRTDPKIVKIIECPYCPIDLTFSSGILVVPTDWRIDQDANLILNNTAAEFMHTLPLQNTNVLAATITVPTNYTHMTKNINLESKLYNSSSYTYKLAYDTYSQEVKLENLTNRPIPTGNLKYTINYKQSNGITSDLAFRVNPTSHTYKAEGDYDLYILSSRNNEANIYTNAYLDYVRTGQYYDRKNASSAEGSAWLGTGVQIVGALVSTALAIPTGGISAVAAVSLSASAISSIANSIYTTAQTERALQQKVDEAKAQASNVAGANDLNLLRWYNGNKVHAVTYSATDIMKDKLFDLYHYCGYATNLKKEPDTTSRYWFNFIQCELVLKDEESTHVFEAYINDIKARYAQGVTVYHNHNLEWDWEQQYENWETSAIQ